VIACFNYHIKSNIRGAGHYLEFRISYIAIFFPKTKRCRLNSSGSGQSPEADSCEHGNEPSGFIKGEKFN
jgi:hypothetical protein